MSVKLKYLDKNGLKKILTLIKNWDLIDAKPTCRDVNGDLVPGQKIVELTKAQYDALATKDPDTYYMVNDDNDPKTWYPRPDWSNAVNVTAAQLYAGYTVPSDGMVVGIVGPNTYNTSEAPTIMINNITVSQGRSTDQEVVVANIQCPVSANDTVKIDNNTCTLARIGAAIHFVPWKS